MIDDQDVAIRYAIGNLLKHDRYSIVFRAIPRMVNEPRPWRQRDGQQGDARQDAEDAQRAGRPPLPQGCNRKAAQQGTHRRRKEQVALGGPGIQLCHALARQCQQANQRQKHEPEVEVCRPRSLRNAQQPQNSAGADQAGQRPPTVFDEDPRICSQLPRAARIEPVQQGCQRGETDDSRKAQLSCARARRQGPHSR